jgi:hypothetical protein
VAIGGIVAIATAHDVYGDLTDTDRWLLLTAPGDAAANGSAACDGHRIYLAPFNAWEAFDLEAQIDSRARGLSGAIFDGEYVYFIGAQYIARFQARTPPAMPNAPGWFSWGPGSFY